MNFQQYLEHFERILHSPKPEMPYDQPEYLNYTELNWSRMNRWIKHGVLNEELVEQANSLESTQFWTVITEPWCGDAAHILPFLELLARKSDAIVIDYQLRDVDPFLIDSYLTGGSRSIPKLIIQNSARKDIAVWGPRPMNSQTLYTKMLSEDIPKEAIKTSIQHWYNENKGVDIQLEWLQLLRNC